MTIRPWRPGAGSVRAPHQALRIPFANPFCEPTLGKEMEAVIAIGVFLAVIILLNIVEFGRAD